jgi:hypothetical protein
MSAVPPIQLRHITAQIPRVPPAPIHLTRPEAARFRPLGRRSDLFLAQGRSLRIHRLKVRIDSLEALGKSVHERVGKLNKAASVLEERAAFIEEALVTLRLEAEELQP